MLPSPLPWLRAHWRPVAIAAGVVVPFAAGVAVGLRWARPPVIDLHQHDQVETHVAQHQVEQKQVQQQATAAAAVEQHEAKELHCTKCKITRSLPTGGSETIEGARIDEGEQLELAQQVDLHATAATSLQLDLTNSLAQVATHDLQLHQEPAPRPSVALGALAGLSDRGPLYSLEGGYRVIGPVWARGQLQVGAILAFQFGAEVQW